MSKRILVVEDQDVGSNKTRLIVIYRWMRLR
jgi:hypothetical protein